jgi:hypothetical protein
LILLQFEHFFALTLPTILAYALGYQVHEKAAMLEACAEAIRKKV